MLVYGGLGIPLRKNQCQGENAGCKRLKGKKGGEGGVKGLMSLEMGIVVILSEKMI